MTTTTGAPASPAARPAEAAQTAQPAQPTWPTWPVRPDEVVDLDALGRSRIEDFLCLEAQLLDAWDLDTWLTLFAPEASYVVPCNDSPDGDPARDLVLIDDDELRLRLRVERLNSRRAHREYPHSRTNHQFSNVVVGVREGDELPVVASFTVWRFRNGKASYYVGKYHYRFVAIDGRLRIRSKRVVLDMTTLRPAGDLAIIL
ncbi:MULTISPECIES: aromatic-ring-hydroxylating dioxygenase subunit beta [Protofrankia]|uniref:aromatic-ring-hydroxylating dioxygenase subunit beta n=1 Tax=Protofrankia TaxID=2994361 RepID=UPI000B338672|nr:MULTISPECIES: aromatic-ring-hydroxylating dioxygenase subunit beta [Protofrankia]